MENNTNEMYKEKYKNMPKIASVMGICKIIKTISAFITIMILIIIIYGTHDTINTSDSEVGPKVLALICYTVLAGIGITIYLLSQYKYSLLEDANFYVSHLRNDVDGFIRISDLAFLVNQSEAILIKRFSKLIRQRYIINCEIEKKNNINYIVLNNSILKQSMKSNEEIREIVLDDIEEFNKLENYKCPNCGNSVEIKDINNVICKYCRTKFIFKEQKVEEKNKSINADTSKTYRNMTKLNFDFIVSIIGVQVFALLAIIFIGTFLTVDKSSELFATPGDALLQYLLYAVSISFSMLFLMKYYKSLKINYIARWYGNCLSKFGTEVIGIKNFASSIYQTEEKVIKNLSLCIKKSYLTNCRLERKNDINYIVLNNSIIKQSIENDGKLKEIILKDIEEYNSITNYPCPTCGATINITDRNNVVCSYCRTRLTFKRIVDDKRKKA